MLPKTLLQSSGSHDGAGTDFDINTAAKLNRREPAGPGCGAFAIGDGVTVPEFAIRFRSCLPRPENWIMVLQIDFRHGAMGILYGAVQLAHHFIQQPGNLDET